MPMGRITRKTTNRTARKVWSWFMGERDVRPHNQVLLGLSFGRTRASPLAAANATTNAGTAVMIGQITSAKASKRRLPVPAVRAWMFAAAARANAPSATDRAA